MTTSPSKLARSLSGPGYFIGTLIIIVPLVEIPAASMPAKIHEAPWRLGLINAMAGGMTIPLLALFVCFALAATTGNRPVLLLISAFCALAAALSVVGAGAFALDALQMKNQVRGDALSRYVDAAGWACFKICMCAAAFGLLAFRSGRVFGAIQRPVSRRSAPAPLLAKGEAARAVAQASADRGDPRVASESVE